MLTGAWLYGGSRLTQLLYSAFHILDEGEIGGKCGTCQHERQRRQNLRE
jgi:hypothetical protein